MDWAIKSADDMLPWYISTESTESTEYLCENRKFAINELHEVSEMFRDLSSTRL
jgi:hypothetical protein